MYERELADECVCRSGHRRRGSRWGIGVEYGVDTRGLRNALRWECVRSTVAAVHEHRRPRRGMRAPLAVHLQPHGPTRLFQ